MYIQLSSFLLIQILSLLIYQDDCSQDDLSRSKTLLLLCKRGFTEVTEVT